MHNHTLPKHIRDGAEAAVAQVEAERAAAEPQEETKPPGYYATCSPEEFRAELHRRGIYSHGHALPGN